MDNAASALWTIVLIKLRSICLLSTDLQEGLHLLPDEFPAAFITQIDLVFIDHHHPHGFPFLPAGFAHLGLDFGFKLTHKQGVGDRFSGLPAGDTLNFGHGVKFLL